MKVSRNLILEGGLLYWRTRKMRFLRDSKCPVNRPPSP